MKTIQDYTPTTTSTGRLGEPTALERIEQNAKTACQLRCVGGDEADRLAETLDSCRPKARCLNAACLMCGATAQQHFIQTALKNWPSGVSLTHVTVVPSEPQRNLGELAALDLKFVAQHLKELLDRAGFVNLRALAFIDLSHSVDHRVPREFWLPHYHMVAAADDIQDLTGKLRSILPPTPSVTRPVVSVKLNDPSVQLHYIAKPRPVRVTRFPKMSRTTRPLKHWLKTREHIEAMLWLGRYSVMDRFVALPGHVRSIEAPRKARSQ